MLGLGYCHAVDRGLQILFVRTLARGRASLELQATDELLVLDRFFRRMNFGADVAEELAALSPRARAAMEAYCRGIDLGFATAGTPWELRLLGAPRQPEPWTFADVALTGKVVGYVSLAACQADMERWIVECVQQGVGRDRLDELFPGQLGGLDEEMLRRVRLEERIVPEELWRVPGLPIAAASNSWVVAGSRTESGAPIACNDPHLQVNRLPAVWYEAVLRWRSDGSPRYAMGATMPGAPGIVVGRTPELAWGVTYACMDCVDSWVEECRDGSYRREDGWRPFRAREETIERRRRPPVTLRFYENEHGTLEGDPHTPGFYLATRWSCGERTGAGSLDAMAGILEARTAEQGRTLLAQVSNSSWSWLLADRGGSIAFQMSGKMPLRRLGVSGLVPLPGWDPANDWRGFARPEDLPRALDPPEGFLATANDDLNALGVLKPINLCVGPYRGERIRAVLSRPGAVSVEDMKALQFDIASTQAERFLAVLRPLLDDAPSTVGARLLRDWDLRYEDVSRGASLFERFYRALFVEVFGGKPRLGLAVADHLLDETGLLGMYYGQFDRVLLSEKSGWFGGRSRSEVYRAALARALDGAGEARPYGEGRRIVLEHILLGGKLPRMLGLDRGPIGLRGCRATVHQGQILRDRGRTSASGPSYRYVTDLATDVLHSTLPGGPSDRPFSRWYANGLAGWRDGVYTVLRGWDDPRSD
jgi:penicillin amidase